MNLKNYFIILGTNIIVLLSGISLLTKRIFQLLLHLSYFGYAKSYNHQVWFWPLLVVFSLLDCLLIPELVHLLLCLAKPNTRLLSASEKTIAKQVYGDSINLSLVMIDEHSFFAQMGAGFEKKTYLGVVIFKSINFNRKINTEENQDDAEWLIHELTHILQFKHYGSAYILYALYAQKTDGYEVNLSPNKTLQEFNFEQQAEIAKYYFRALNKDKNDNHYAPFIEDIQKGKFIS